LPEYKGVTVTREEEEINEDSVNEVVANICERFVTFEDRGDKDLVAENDLVQITYNGTFEGKPVGELDEDLGPIFAGQEDFWTQANEAMGSGEGPSIIPGLGTVLVGLAIGDSTDTDVEFEDDCPAEILRGKTVNYTLSVGAARGRIVPEMDDELAKKTGFDTVEELRTDIQNNLETQAKTQSENKVRNDVLESLLEGLEFEMPKSLVEEETRQEIYRQVNRISQQGASEDLISEHKDEIFSNANKSTEDRLRVEYLCKRIAKAEDIEVHARDIDEEIIRMSASYRMQPDELRQNLESSNRIEALRTDLIIKKTIDFLVEHAEIQE